MGSNARVINALQGVLFEVISEGRMVRAVVLGQYLQRQFGALDDPDDWLRVYQLRADLIDAEALRLDLELGAPAIVVVQDTGEQETVPAFLPRF